MKTTTLRLTAFLSVLALAACDSTTETDVGGALTPETVVSTAGDKAVTKGPSDISASGGGHFNIPPEEFGAEVGNVLTFSARKTGEDVSGHFNYQQTFMGDQFHFNGPVTCFNVYDGNRAKVGALIEVSNDPTIPAGLFIWWSVIDNGQGNASPPDESTLIGVGDEEANEAFCDSSALPRFGPWPLDGGNFHVRD